MSTKPTVDGLKMAVCLATNIKGATPFDVIGIAGAFDAYLAGMIEAVPIKVTSDDFQVAVQLKPDGEPAEDGRTASAMTSDFELKRSDFVEGQHGDQNYQIELACDRLMRTLPQKTLELVNSGAFPAGLASVINSCALAELERRDALRNEEKA